MNTRKWEVGQETPDGEKFITRKDGSGKESIYRIGEKYFRAFSGLNSWNEPEQIQPTATMIRLLK